MVDDRKHDDEDGNARRLGLKVRKPPRGTNFGPRHTAGAIEAAQDRKNGTIPQLTFRLHTRVA